MRPTVVDSSVWIEHLRRGNKDLVELLSEDRVLMHQLVILELACGSIPKRNAFIADLEKLPKAPDVPFSEVLQFVDRTKIYARGIGAVDATLIVSAKNSDAELLTYDRKLQTIWKSLKI